MPDTFRLRLSLLPLALLMWGLAGCSSAPASKAWLDTVSPYRFDRVQGNVITREQLAALKTGMPHSVVKDILGTPLLTSVFHADRWDYVFTLSRQGAAAQSRRVTLYFKGDALERFDSDELPSEAEFVATLKSMPKLGTLPTLEASPESLKNFPPAAKAAVLTPAPSKTLSSYPPLEPQAK